MAELKYKNYTVEPIPEKLPYVQMWTFKHRIQGIKLVCQYSNGKITGDLEMIKFLRTNNIIPENYIPCKQDLKDYYEDVERSQTHCTMGKSSQRRNFDND